MGAYLWRSVETQLQQPRFDIVAHCQRARYRALPAARVFGLCAHRRLTELQFNREGKIVALLLAFARHVPEFD